MDISTATNVRELDEKLIHGTAASLSKIEKQNGILERIQSYSETGMQSSVASVRSLHSIANSLSRIEAMASSSETFPKFHRRGDSDEIRDGIRTKRVSNDEIETRSRRSSGGHAIANKSSYTSLRSSASVMSPPTLVEEPSGSDLTSQRFSSPHCSFGPERKHVHLHKRWSDSTGPVTFQAEPYTDSDIAEDKHIQLSCFGRSNSEYSEGLQAQKRNAERWETQYLWDILSEQQPASVLEYITLVRKCNFLQNKIDALHLLNHGSELSLPSKNECNARHNEWIILQGRLNDVRYALTAARKRCVLEGHSLYEFDQRLRPPTNNDKTDRFWDQYNEHERSQANNRYLQEMRDGETAIFGEWSTTRDRINCWMLHCLQSDDAQTQVHRSMLAEPPLDDEHWAIQVLDNWEVDEAALGHSLETAHSAGAVDSREVSQLERPISDIGLKVVALEISDEANGGEISQASRMSQPGLAGIRQDSQIGSGPRSWQY